MAAPNLRLRTQRDGTGIGSSGLPGGIDEQFCGAGCPAKRSLIHPIAFSSQIPTLVV